MGSRFEGGCEIAGELYGQAVSLLQAGTGNRGRMMRTRGFRVSPITFRRCRPPASPSEARTVPRESWPDLLRLRPNQKWMMMSLAAMTAQLLVGAIPASGLPLKAATSIER